MLSISNLNLDGLDDHVHAANTVAVIFFGKLNKATVTPFSTPLVLEFPCRLLHNRRYAWFDYYRCAARFFDLIVNAVRVFAKFAIFF